MEQHRSGRAERSFQLWNLLVIHSPEARDYLLAERCPPESIHQVGNTIIDTLVELRDAIARRAAP